MRVLMVSDVYFPRINGVSTSIETFRQALQAHDVRVDLVVPRYADEPDQAGVTRVAGRPVPGDPEDRLCHWREMHRVVAEAAHHCDLVHVKTPFVAHYAGLAAARRHNKPVLATYHTLFEEYVAHYAPFLPGGVLRALARRLSRRQCNALDALVVPSQAMQSRLTAYGVQVPLHVLPTGIPLDRFVAGDGRAFRAWHGIEPARPVALFVGRLAHEKNIGFLLEAVVEARRHCPELLLLIAGEGPASDSLRRQAAALGVTASVQFLGYLDRGRDLPACYAAADVFAFASRTETQGLVLLEAMAAGTPVLGLAEMGTCDILAGERGCRIGRDDPVAFGQELAALLNDHGQRARLAEAARAWAAEWSEAAMASRLAGVYRGLLRT